MKVAVIGSAGAMGSVAAGWQLQIPIPCNQALVWLVRSYEETF